ncbi:MAG TPA: mechanosensitive ion channel domain-containing protein [Patescibacteria group bacterium]|nr:mechanosensitive ion channel domain-containing protein [Patescibacteria group bacterium]
MQETLNKIYGYAIQYGLNVVFALLILIVGKWVARIVSRVLEATLVKAKINKTLAVFTKNIAYFGILVFVVLAALNKLGIETTSFIAIIGAAGLAVGLALQGSLANFAAGVMIVILQPFGVGDMVDAGGASGTVEEIQIFSTILITPENKKVIVPNAKITADKIVIHSQAKK